MPGQSVTRSFLAVDIENFEGRPTDDVRVRLRRELREIVAHALASVTLDGQEPEHRIIQDTGDGVLCVVNARHLGQLVDSVAHIRGRARKANQSAVPEAKLRLRVVVHTGQVFLDELRDLAQAKQLGTAGADLIHTFRLLDSQEFRDHLKKLPDEVLVLAVSNYIHEHVIRHGDSDLFQADTFEAMDVSVKETRARAWVSPRLPVTTPPPPEPSPPLPRHVLRRLQTALAGLWSKALRILRAALGVVLAVAIVAGLQAAGLAAWSRLGPCPVPTQLVVLASPSIYVQIQELAERFVDQQDNCLTGNLRVFTAPSYGEVAEFAATRWSPDALEPLGPEPDVWIAESTSVTRSIEHRLGDRLGDRFDDLIGDFDEPVATTPLVLAAEEGFIREFGLEGKNAVTWNGILQWQGALREGNAQLVRASPTVSGGALLATEKLYAAGPDTPAARQDLERSIHPASGDERAELCEMGTVAKAGARAPRALLTSEQLMAVHNGKAVETERACGTLAEADRLRALYLYDAEGRSPVLDYRYMPLSSAFAHPEGARERLAKDFYDYLTGPSAQSWLRSEGFHDNQGASDPGMNQSVGVDSVQSEQATAQAAGHLPQQVVDQTISRWEVARPQVRILLAMDVSASMDEPYERGGRRVEAAREAAAEFVGQLSDRDYVGLWQFADNLDQGLTHQELVEVGRASDPVAVDGSDRLEVVVDRLAALEPVARATRLYTTVLAGIDELGETSVPGEAKGMVVVTDGSDEERTAASAEAVIAKLKEGGGAGSKVFAFLLVFGPAGCDLEGLRTLDGHPNAVCIDANESGLPAAFAQISSTLLG